MIPINLYTQMFFQSEEGANTKDRLSSDSAIPTESCSQAGWQDIELGGISQLHPSRRLQHSA